MPYDEKSCEEIERNHEIYLYIELSYVNTISFTSQIISLSFKNNTITFIESPFTHDIIRIINSKWTDYVNIQDTYPSS